MEAAWTLPACPLRQRRQGTARREPDPSSEPEAWCSGSGGSRRGAPGMTPRDREALERTDYLQDALIRCLEVMG
jgi:hypothetical protein